MPRIPSVPTGTLLALAVLFSAPAAAQSSPAAREGLSLRPLLVGGLGRAGGDAHPFFGLQASVSGGRFGATVEGHGGRGNGFSSAYLGGGPAVRVSPDSRVELRGFAGLGVYREALEKDPRRRSVVGPTAGLLGLVPVGPLRVGGGVTGWWGSYSGRDVVAPVPGGGIRAVLAVGW